MIDCIAHALLRHHAQCISSRVLIGVRFQIRIVMLRTADDRFVDNSTHPRRASCASVPCRLISSRFPDCPRNGGSIPLRCVLEAKKSRVLFRFWLELCVFLRGDEILRCPGPLKEALGHQPAPKGLSWEWAWLLSEGILMPVVPAVCQVTDQRQHDPCTPDHSSYPSSS